MALWIIFIICLLRSALTDLKSCLVACCPCFCPLKFWHVWFAEICLGLQLVEELAPINANASPSFPMSRPHLHCCTFSLSKVLLKINLIKQKDKKTFCESLIQMTLLIKGSNRNGNPSLNFLAYFLMKGKYQSWNGMLRKVFSAPQNKK